MQQVHAGLEYKSFPAADWIGGDTQIFGDLTEAKEEQDNPSPSPSEEPAASGPPPAVPPGRQERHLQLMMQLLRAQDAIQLVGEINKQLGIWLINHIKTEDTKVARHIQAWEGHGDGH